MCFLNPQKSYTFSKFFELKIQSKELSSDFGFTLTQKQLNLPQYPSELDRLGELKSRVEKVFPFIDLANETTHREMLIVLVISDFIHYRKSEVRIDYPN